MRDRLSSWFAIWHRSYRGILTLSLVSSAVGSVLIYLDDALLAWMTAALSAGVGADVHSSQMPVLLRGAGTATTISLMLLAVFVVNRVATAWVGFMQARAVGRMTIDSKADLEREVLDHLLRQDDAFFSRHSPAETVNRLAVDLARISQRRPNLMQLWWSALLIIGNLVFFLVNDWRLSLVAVGGCVVGGLWASTMSRRVKRTDAGFLRQDDTVKSRFEDFLRAYQEVQIGRLQPAVLDQLGQAQTGRNRTFLRYVTLNEFVNIGNLTSNLLAFAAMIGVIIYKHYTGAQSAALMLIPVVIHTLPYLSKHSAKIITLALDYQLAATSMNRLLEYESRLEEPAAGAEDGPARRDGVARQGEHSAAQPIELRDCTFQYTSADGARQGGIVGVSTHFSPGQWTAVVGGAGSGKSTMIKLLLGQLSPHAGKVLYHSVPAETISPDERSRLFTMMPQSPALLNATIEANLLLGRDGDAATLTDEDIDVIERAGLGLVCRLKALDMPAFSSLFPAGDGLGEGKQRTSATSSPPPPLPSGRGENTLVSLLQPRIATLRDSLRRRLADECGVTVRPFEQNFADPRHWWLEVLLAGRCDRQAALDRLTRRHAQRQLVRLASGPSAGPLLSKARALLGETRRLLELDSLHLYNQLATFPLDERVWQWRRGCRHLAGDDAQSSTLPTREKLLLCLIGLTGCIGEMPPSSPLSLKGEGRGERALSAGPFAALADLFAGIWQPFDMNRLHPFLSWRENLVFGLIDATNSRSARLVDQVILQFIADEQLLGPFTRAGLKFNIGRLGSNLSGGQGQLVSLCRSLLRRTPVLVLDEPTSALDPASRTRVAELLGQWKADRVVITISHDAEFVRQADQVRLMDGGRLAGSGTFEQLRQDCEVFRRTLRQE